MNIWRAEYRLTDSGCFTWNTGSKKYFAQKIELILPKHMTQSLVAFGATREPHNITKQNSQWVQLFHPGIHHPPNKILEISPQFVDPHSHWVSNTQFRWQYFLDVQPLLAAAPLGQQMLHRLYYGR
jgi:hypothetical protein